MKLNEYFNNRTCGNMNINKAYQTGSRSSNQKSQSYLKDFFQKICLAWKLDFAYNFYI